MEALRWQNDKLWILDQTKLPVQVEYLECKDYLMVGEAIKKLRVRGAPAIGVAAAYGLYIGVRQLVTGGMFSRAGAAAVDAALRATRPTAKNLFWALDRMQKVTDRAWQEPQKLLPALEAEAEAIYAENAAVNERIAENGAGLLQGMDGVLTHCNAGALGTAAVGTALGVIKRAYAKGYIKRVFSDETRPLLQGSRLTAFELVEDKVPVTVITDSMAGLVMKQNKVQAVIVGADRITANGDTANKIGTYSVAVLAEKHNIPFYVAAPLATFDFQLQNGSEIPIEQRSGDEVRFFGGVQTAPTGADVYNPAFDVTPHELISGIITEYGIVRPRDKAGMQKLIDEQAKRRDD